MQEVRLMTQSELRAAFPEAKIVPERFGGLVESWTAVGGFPLLEGRSRLRESCRN